MEIEEPDNFTPRSDLERSICSALEEFTESEVFSLQTPDEYRADELFHEPVRDDFDYIAVTGIRWRFNGMLRAGELVGVKLVEQEILLEILGRWMT